VRDVLAVAADPSAPLADKMELYEKSAVMTTADRQRLGEMIAVVKRRQETQSAIEVSPAAAVLPSRAGSLPAFDAPAVSEGDPVEADELTELGPPMQRYNGRRLMARLGVGR
jgi:hypothetical protein